MLHVPETVWSLVVLPKRSYVVSMAKELRALLEPLGISIAMFHDRGAKPAAAAKTIRLLTPADLLEAMSKPSWERSLNTLKLIVLENLELLDAEYEMGVSFLLQSTSRHSIREVGISASLTDASDLAGWLHVPSPTLCCFRPRDREQDLKSSIQTFNIPHSAALLRAMAKPAHAAITAAGADPTIVFVPSRSQCHLVADDLMRQCANASKLQGYLPGNLSVKDIEPYVSRLQDHSLLDILSHGIGIFHEGVSKSDRNLVMEMYKGGILPVLLMPKDACWSFTERSGCVVVMGTQYVRVERESGEHHVRDYTIPEVSRMQGRAVRHGRSGRFNVFCQSESKETLMRFLEDGLPLESTLHDSSMFQEWLCTQWRNGMISDKQQAVHVLSWTYLARRMLSNPMYYDAVPGAVEESLSRLIDRLLEDETK
jgi:antiviral helicase SLH1